MEDIIDKFTGEFEFLSNFYDHPIYYMGFHFPRTENAYQAAKLDPRDRTEEWAQHLIITANKSKRLGKQLQPLRPGWDTGIKDRVMHEVVSIKFEDPELRKLLLATGEAKLIEGNWWHDTYWGVCNGVGKNKLGELLMYLRARIRLEIALN